MNEILKLQQRIAGLVKENRGLLDSASAEDRALTDEETAASDTRTAEIGTLQKRVKALEAQEQQEAALAQGTRRVPVAGVEVHDAGEEVQEVRFGRWLQSVWRAGTGHGIDARLEASETETRAATGMSAAIGAEGGFMVQKDVSQTIIERAYATGAILSRVTKLPALSAGADSIDLPAIDETSRVAGSRMGGVLGYWIGEGTAPTASKPKLRQIGLKVNGLGCLGYATDRLLRNAAVLGDIMMRGFQNELVFMTEDAIINGLGGGQPTGIGTAACLVSVAKEGAQTADTVVSANIAKMWARMYAPCRTNAIWLINQEVEAQLELLSMVVGTGGVPVYLPAGGFADTPNARLKGRPVVPVEYCAKVGDQLDIILADLSQYYMIDLGGPEPASSIHVAFTTFEQAFRIIYYVDGKPTWNAALTPFKATTGATLSPFVTLDARA